ncbi:CCCH-type zinc finger family protein [Wolffia australiana]
MNIEETSRASGEAVKKNIDCIYFLASPLTCKKGSECEFRHAEAARANPRDCWYWLNGNCLNPKCLFRHPPLESTFPVIPDQTSATAHLSGGKLKTPCYYFQKGCCLKGDKCPFSHGPQAANNPNPAAPAAKAFLSKQEPANPSKPRTSAETAAEAQPPTAKNPSNSSGLQKRLPTASAALQGKTQNGTGSEQQQQQKKKRPHEDRVPGFDVLVEDSRRPSSERVGPQTAPVDGSDLRLRLLKKRNGEEEDRRRRGPNSGGSALSSRLRGRISLPDKDEDIRGNPADFAGPRSLAELRAAKSSDERLNRLSASFEAPKPLGEILKRKRQAAREEPAIEDGELDPETDYSSERRAAAEPAGSSPSQEIPIAEDDAASDDDGDEFAREIGIIFS